MNTTVVDTMAMGKIPMSFLDYELVLQNKGDNLFIVSINIVHKGKILTKIKSGTKILKSNTTDLDTIVQQTIIGFFKNDPTSVNESRYDENNIVSNPTKKQKKARMQAAQTLFNDFNL